MNNDRLSPDKCSRPQPGPGRDSNRPTPAGRKVKPLPSIDEAMNKPYLTIEDVAVIMTRSVEAIRTMMDLDTIIKPIGKRGRRWYWRRSDFLSYMDPDVPEPTWASLPQLNIKRLHEI